MNRRKPEPVIEKDGYPYQGFWFTPVPWKPEQKGGIIHGASSDLFRDRIDAGRRLAKELSRRSLPKGEEVVLGIPRGGVVVAAEVAEKPGLTLDLIIARKLRAPSQPELGIGAVVDGTHIVVLNDELLLGRLFDVLCLQTPFQSGGSLTENVQIIFGAKPNSFLPLKF